MPASNTTGVFTATDVYDRAINDMWVTSGFFGDPYFSQTTLLISADGANNANNNVFLDSSTNNFPITKNGNTAQGTFTPYGSKWATRFSGQNYVYTPAHSDYDITGGDFTIEFWINWEKGNNMASSGFVVATNFVSSVGWSIGFGSTSDNIADMQFGAYNAGWTFATNTSITDANLKRNTWNHIAIVRSGNGAGNLKFYLNGVATGGAFNAPSYPGAGNALYWGIYAENYTYSGNPTFSLSNFRIVKGRAVYTTNFTPSTRTFANVTNTTLLTHNNNRFTNTANALTTFTPAGTFPAITKYSPVDPSLPYTPLNNGGSAYFDGTGDYLSVPANSALTLGTGDHTIECWAYQAGTQQTYTTLWAYAGTTTNQNTDSYYLNVGAGGSGLLLGSGGAWGIQISFTAPSLNTWHHYAVTRVGNVFTVYVDGVSVGTGTYAANIPAQTAPMVIGTQVNGGSTNLIGYMTDFRVVKGAAVYTGNFTPPTAPLLPSGTPSIYPSAANVNTTFSSASTPLLLNFRNTGIIDYTGINNLDNIGDTKISTANSVFGGSAMFFDGTGDYLNSASNQAFAFGLGDFTIEGWFRFTGAMGTYQRPWWFGDDNDNLEINSGVLRYGGASLTVITGPTVQGNVWYHIAYTRASGNGRLFVNGGNVGATTTSTYNSVARTFTLMATSPSNGGNNPSTGFVDDFRITKGVARYTANFTPAINTFSNFYAPN